ncbi:hypothetical protein [Streptomyces apricus]|uniref:Uncharacterized protein n=1 Tax=Streptomyces apricus TaxID=1828112 RepID=A0A5B0AQM3_9ACTN|nr:hypothetical protein [Streptomyces apricus]KAA0932293.1 hypothetical protein FGF04_26355 [Streptomyces apricus]
MGPNDTEIVRVFARSTASPSADPTLDPKEAAQIVVEAEAGDAVFRMGVPYEVDVTVKDLVDGTNIPTTPAGAVTGQLSQAPWNKQHSAFVFGVAASELEKHKGHQCEVYATVYMGLQEPDASFATSPRFLVQR